MFSQFLSFFSFSLPKIVLNDRTIHVKHDLTWGVNVENAAHPCAGSPCAHGGVCRPRKEGYECDCPLGFEGLHCQKGTRGSQALPRGVGGAGGPLAAAALTGGVGDTGQSCRLFLSMIPINVSVGR